VRFKRFDLDDQLSFLQCFDTVGLVILLVKIIPEMTYNVLNGILSLYTTTTTLPASLLICNITSRLYPSHTQHSTSQLFLDCPLSLPNFGERPFSHLTPTVWNGLPCDVTLSPTIDMFTHSEDLHPNYTVYPYFTNATHWGQLHQVQLSFNCSLYQLIEG